MSVELIIQESNAADSYITVDRTLLAFFFREAYHIILVNSLYLSVRLDE